MHVRRFATYVEVLTPAKVNQFLGVLAKRPDGYHELETLLAAVACYDTLHFAPDDGGQIQLDCRWAAGHLAREMRSDRDRPAARELLYGEIPAGPENLVWRAAALVRDRAGISRGATIRLIKRIPAAAGLGGASSDAAATLIAANTAWQVGWPRERLLALAAELGSDVPFFLTPGAAVGRGRGERIEGIRIPRLHIVIVRPPVGLRTPDVYRRCRPAENKLGVTTLTEAPARGDLAEAARRLKNDLEPAARQLTPWIDTLRSEFDKQDLLGHQMSGSGSSYFGLCRSARQARRIAARLRARDIGVAMAMLTASGDTNDLRMTGTSE